MAAARRQTSTRRAALPPVADSLPWETPVEPVRAWAREAIETSTPFAPLAAPKADERPTAPTGDPAPAAASGASLSWDQVELVAERPWGDKPPKGDEWRVLAYFPAHGKQFAGTGPTVWVALAELVDDWQHRGINGGAFRPARTA